MTATAILGGFGADLVLGDPRRLHPVAGFGRVALAAERAGYAPTRPRGVAYTAALVLGAVAVAELAVRAASRAGVPRAAAEGALTWAALGGRSLVSEATCMAGHLERHDLDAARAALPALCGRDPGGLDAPALCRATVESVAENTADAVVGALVWGAAAGSAGVIGYRAANTLDAMVGHRSERYAAFGWASARLDDLLGYPGARLAALLAALCAPLVGGAPGAAWRTVRADAGAHPSPNAGLGEAAFAGALGLRLGGPLSYDGRTETRPAMGSGRPPVPEDIRRACRLSLAVCAVAAAASAVVATIRRRIGGPRR